MDWTPRTKIGQRAAFLAGLDGDPVGAAFGGDRAALSECAPGPAATPVAADAARPLDAAVVQPSLSSMEDLLGEGESVHRLVGFHPTTDLVPDDTVIMPTRHLFEKHRLAEGRCTHVRARREERKLLVTSGTIVNATIIAAPLSRMRRRGETRRRSRPHKASSGTSGRSDYSLNRRLVPASTCRAIAMSAASASAARIAS